jgi:uncharacterized protein (TIGR00369 family)
VITSSEPCSTRSSPAARGRRQPEFKINYLAAVTAGVLDARAEIISLTKRTAVVRIDVENEGRLVCAAQGAVLVVAPKQPDAETPG